MTRGSRRGRQGARPVEHRPGIDRLRRMTLRAALKSLCVTWSWAFLLATVGPAHAAEWSALPSVSVRTLYNDNLNLAPGGGASVWGLVVSPDVKFSVDTETLKATGGLNVSFNRYFGEEGLDTNNYDLSLRLTRRTERDVMGLNVDAIRDSTLVSELAETGVALAYRQRNLQTATPSWSRALTEATFLKASYTFTNVHYDDTAGTRLIDYRDQIASVTLQRAFDERNVGSIAVYGDRFETRPSQFDATTYGVQVGYEHLFSETLRGSLVVGNRWTRSDVTSNALICDGPIIVGICFGTVTQVTLDQRFNSSGYTLKALLENRWETDTLSGSLSRDIYPSGIGSLIETDRLEVAWTKQWSPMLSATLLAAAYQSRYIGGAVIASDSRYYRIRPQVSWRFAENWIMEAGYQYARQKYDTRPLAATANLIYVNVAYTWPKLSVSR